MTGPGHDGLSPSNPKLQRLRRLSRRRSARRDEGRFLLEGPNLVAEALSARTGLEVLFVELDAEGRPPVSVSDLVADARRAGVPTEFVRADALRRVLDLAAPQPVVAVATPRRATLSEVLDAAVAAGRPVLVLGGVADPGNAGTLIRVAEAAGVAAVVATIGSVDLHAPKCVRAAAGSVLRVALVEEVASDAVVDACRERGLPLVGTVARGGTNLWDVDEVPAAALIVGSEAHGLPPDLAEALTLGLTIPMEGEVESLNAGVAGALVVMEWARRRHRAPGGQPGSDRGAAVQQNGRP